MADLFNLFLLVVATFCVSTVFSQDRTDFYSTWMTVMSDTLYSKRLFDIVLPGAHHSGMYSSAISELNQSSSDSYSDLLNTYASSAADKISWSTRQSGDILSQLEAGARFFDLRFQTTDGSTFYAYHGMRGAEVHIIASDIAAYFSEYNPTLSSDIPSTDIVILYLSNFQDSGGDRDADLLALFTAITFYFPKALSSWGRMANTTDSAYDIASSSLQTLVDNNIRLIIFTDELPSSSSNVLDYFYDSSTYLSGSQGTSTTVSNDTDLTTADAVISNVVLQLIDGWDTSTKLNQIYYTLEIETNSEMLTVTARYDSFAKFNPLIGVTLESTIYNYPFVDAFQMLCKKR